MHAMSDPPKANMVNRKDLRSIRQSTFYSFDIFRFDAVHEPASDRADTTDEKLVIQAMRAC